MYSKWYSHYNSSCNDAEYTKKKFSGSVSDRDTITKSFKKQDKHCKKELRRVQMNTDKFKKIAYKDLKKSDLKKIAKKMKDSTESYSDSSIKQEICRYEPVDK